MHACGGTEAAGLLCAALADPRKSDAAQTALHAVDRKLRADRIGQIDLKRLMLWYTLLGACDLSYGVVNCALDRCAESGSVGSAWGVLWLPEMRRFREDGRFKALVMCLRLIQYWEHSAPLDNCELRGGELRCG
jgi:hypothetical protein